MSTDGHHQSCGEDEQREQKQERNEKLLEAAREGNVDLVITLLAEGAEVEYKDRRGDTAAHKAAIKGHDVVLTILLDKGAMVNTRGLFDRTPIMCAAENGHTSTVKLLHSRGAELDLQDEDGRTALIYAARYGNLETAAQLLVLGADTALQDENGDTAEQCAKQRGHHDIASHLNTWTQHKDLDKVMFNCAKDGNEKLIGALMTLGVISTTLMGEVTLVTTRRQRMVTWA